MTSKAHSTSATDPLVLEVDDATRLFGEVVALDHVSISARAGEFLTFLGPSGSGKTTLLRIIAGLDEPTAIRTLKIGGEDVRFLAANKRNVTTVFQHYGLFPNMSVGENVGFGLMVKRAPENERRRRSHELLELMRLPGVYDRRIHQLSAGQRQRVALARALAPQPKILLLDEHLAALDERLRHDMQVELKELQANLGTTFIYVTHSQEEALTMSDRVAVLNQGRIVQNDAPSVVFNRPSNCFVADFKIGRASCRERV